MSTHATDLPGYRGKKHLFDKYLWFGYLAVWVPGAVAGRTRSVGLSDGEGLDKEDHEDG